MASAVVGNLLQNNDFGTNAGLQLAPLTGFVDGGGNMYGPLNAALSNFTARDLAYGGPLIRGTRLDASGGRTKDQYGGLVRSIPSGIGFFNSGVSVASGGRWMLDATNSSNWGYFIVETH
jgi:hypothetical protein